MAGFFFPAHSLENTVPGYVVLLPFSHCVQAVLCVSFRANDDHLFSGFFFHLYVCLHGKSRTQEYPVPYNIPMFRYWARYTVRPRVRETAALELNCKIERKLTSQVPGK